MKEKNKLFGARCRRQVAQSHPLLGIVVLYILPRNRLFML